MRTFDTTIRGIKKVYAVLEPVGLSEILTGMAFEKDLDLKLMTNAIFKESMINDLCRAMTGSDEDFESLNLTEVEDIILGFFGVFSKQLQESRILGSAVITKNDIPVTSSSISPSSSSEKESIPTA